MDACAELPAYMAEKKPISDRDLEDKKEGRYFTGLPLANSDPVSADSRHSTASGGTSCCSSCRAAACQLSKLRWTRTGRRGSGMDQ